MRQLLVLFAVVVLIISLWSGVYFIFRPKEGKYAYNPIMTKQLYLSDSELEEELIFFLTKQLGIYQGEFEIEDIVSLNTRDMVGIDYILVTLRAPDGQLYQVTISRKSGLGAKWEFSPKSFSLINIPKYRYNFSFSKETAQWMQDSGITLEQVFEYCKAHPQTYPDGEKVFFDKETGRHSLPADWSEAVKIEKKYNLLTNKNEPIRFISTIEETPIDSIWMVDYPTEYLGPGYRAYLYNKVKSKK